MFNYMFIRMKRRKRLKGTLEDLVIKHLQFS